MAKKGGKGRTDGGGKDFYETDSDFFDCVNHEFRFGLDAAASIVNTKCENFIDEEEDSTNEKADWLHKVEPGESIWINPPYSRGMVSKFLEKAWETSQRGVTVVVLVHTCTDTKYWDDWVWEKAAEVRHIKGRLNFWFGKEGNTSDLPHSLIIYRSRYLGSTYQTSWDWKSDYINRLGPRPIRDKKTREIKYYVNIDGDRI